ncbi:MAG: Wzy polymerase domain-containing protein [Betaproteobacteria bacterium]|nr:Wzy polymerase domain-containing protein [Betaproteobacteria bacterium]
MACALLLACAFRFMEGGGRAAKSVFLLGVPLWVVGLLALVAPWQAALPGMSVGWLAYLGLFGLAYAFAMSCMRQRDLGALQWLAGAFLACALLQSLCGLAQLFGAQFGGLVLAKLYHLVFGNIGQANHFASLLWLGLAGALYLYLEQKLPFAGLALLGAWLALACAASASRGAWLYTAAFAVLALYAGLRQGNTARRMMLGGLAIAGLSALAQFVVSYGHVLDVFGVTSSLQRLDDASSNGQRLHDWHIAWEAIKAHPWLGNGLGSFYRLSVEAAIAGPGKPFPMLAEHAHNLPLHLAAELGAPVVVAVCGLVGYWLVRLLRMPLTPERFFALCGIFVIGLHSMVEYPLWYTYFIVPMGLFCGIADADNERLPKFGIPRPVVFIVLILSFAMLAWVTRDWLLLRAAYTSWNAQGQKTASEERERTRKQAARISDYSLFAAEARNIALQTWLPAKETSPWMARQCDVYWKIRPDWAVMIHCAVAYAAIGEAENLDRVLTTLCRGFPKHHALLYEWIRTEAVHGGLPIEAQACWR